jgi:hypothetical protein
MHKRLEIMWALVIDPAAQSILAAEGRWHA